MISPEWEAKAENCRKILRDSLNPAWLLAAEDLPPADQLNVTTFIDKCALLTPREHTITNSNGVDLVTRMQEGTLTAVETVTAFLKRAHIAHQLTNFATEFMVDDALKAAAELDAHYKSTGKIKGPLHGLPISTKEHIGFKDRICHSAFVALTDNVATEDALLVQLAKQAGAVFHVRTNEPQSVMHFDCSNEIYGTTVNPHNRKLTCGGSSGGEGASLGMRCAALGLGTDLGGSVRVPAAFCGAYGFRTTALRNPYKGICLPGAGQETIRCVICPLANSMADLDLFQASIMAMEPWELETSLVPLPWKKVQPYSPPAITIGVIWDDGRNLMGIANMSLTKMVHPHPPVLRALKLAVDRLKQAGMKVVDFDPYDHQEGWDIISTSYFTDGARAQKDLLNASGEPIAELTSWIFSKSRPEPLSVTENWALNVRRDVYRDAYHGLMKERGVDFLLTPAYIGCASELGTAQYIHYTSIWNMLDFPSITFPSGVKVDPSIDPVDANYVPRSAEDEREYKKYAPEICVGAPIALQVVGKHFRDEETVAATALISQLVQGLGAK